MSRAPWLADGLAHIWICFSALTVELCVGLWSDKLSTTPDATLSFTLVDPFGKLPQLRVGSLVPTQELLTTNSVAVDRSYWPYLCSSFRHSGCSRALLPPLQEPDWVYAVSRTRSPIFFQLTNTCRTDSLINTLVMYTLTTGVITRYGNIVVLQISIL